MPLQRAAAPPGGAVAAYAQGRARASPPNRTGLPDGLKGGIEALSGVALDHVRVHRNSTAPAGLNAHAYTRGSEIHLAPGQERHLPHEAWHVVQQAQGRVRPTMALGGTAINDEAGLETEAETMGSRALTVAPRETALHDADVGGGEPVAQCVTINVKRGQKLIKDQPPGTKHGAVFAWDSKFDLDVIDHRIVVTIRIKADMPPQQFQEIWADQVAGQWSNRFAVHYDGESYPIIVNLVQVDKGEHYAVTAFKSDKVFGTGKRGHFGTDNMLVWGANDVTNVSHEVGHMLGNPDEYGIVEANGRTVDYLAKPSDTIMGKPANNPVAEHYELIREYAEAELRKLHKTAKTATVGAHFVGRLGMQPLSFNPSAALGVTLSKSTASPKPQPKQEEEENELTKAFKLRASRPSPMESISFSKPPSQGSQSLQAPMFMLSPPKKVESLKLGPPISQEKQDLAKMGADLEKAEKKAAQHPESWVVARLVTYIKRTIRQYQRGDSQSWCVQATGGFLKDIDQAIKEKHLEGPWPSFMREKEEED
jgi:hypothetical protein